MNYFKKDTINARENLILTNVLDSVLARLSDFLILYGSKEEQIEFLPRDGFYPFSDNHGGRTLVTHHFGQSDIEALVHNKKIRAALARIVENQREYAREEIMAKHPDLTDEDEIRALAGDIDIDEDESYEVAVQFIFHGKEKNSFKFTVQAWVNWEFPYHRAGENREVVFKKTVTGTERTIEGRLEKAAEKLLNEL